MTDVRASRTFCHCHKRPLGVELRIPIGELLMAKLFYTLSETSKLLGKTEDEVREMAKSGQLEEMRDGDEVMFKRKQIDLLVGDRTEDLELDISPGGSSVGFGLADSAANVPAPTIDDHSDTEDLSTEGSGYGMSDSGTGLGLAGSAAGLDLGGSGFGFELGDSGSGMGLDLGGDSNAGSGIAAALEGGEDDDSAETRVAGVIDEELSLEAVGSGSGLLDLTRESDDTSLGAELLDEVWEGDDNSDFNVNASGLFESADSNQPEQAASGTPMGLMVAQVEQYDGKWSGAGVGFLFGALVSLVAVLVMLMSSIMGVSQELGSLVTGDLMIWGGGFAGLAIIAGLIGMFIGKASE